jgi:6,7-dimethyl-8-ribityllumazine synthase
MTSSTETELDLAALRSLDDRVGKNLEGTHDGTGLRIGVACARFNGGITMRMMEGVLAAAGAAGVDRSDILVAWVPGAFELPLLAQTMIGSGQVDAVVALGAVIRGDTGHYDFVAGECARGLQDVSLATGKPVIFGVLTTDTVEQALERSVEGEGNKGAEALETAIEMVRLAQTSPLG